MNSLNFNNAIVSETRNLRESNLNRYRHHLLVHNKKNECLAIKQRSKSDLNKRNVVRNKVKDKKKLAINGNKHLLSLFNVRKEMINSNRLLKSVIMMKRMEMGKSKKKQFKILQKCSDSYKLFQESYSRTRNMQKINTLKGESIALKKEINDKAKLISDGQQIIEEVDTLLKKKIIELAESINRLQKNKQIYEEQRTKKSIIAQLKAQIEALKITNKSKQSLFNEDLYYDLEFKDDDEIHSIQPASVASPQTTPSCTYDQDPPSCLSLSLAMDRSYNVDVGPAEETNEKSNDPPTFEEALYEPLPSAVPSTEASVEHLTGDKEEEDLVSQNEHVDAASILNEPVTAENHSGYYYNASEFDARFYTKSPEAANSASSASAQAPSSPMVSNIFNRKEEANNKSQGQMFFNFGIPPREVKSSIFNLF